MTFVMLLRATALPNIIMEIPPLEVDTLCCGVISTKRIHGTTGAQLLEEVGRGQLSACLDWSTGPEEGP